MAGIFYRLGTFEPFATASLSPHQPNSLNPLNLQQIWVDKTTRYPLKEP
ncbi:MAG: hypothetical protein AB4050_17210 [Synechococcus sp.]